MINLPLPPLPRVEACLNCGTAERLHPLLATWPPEELHQLLIDLRVAYQKAVAHLNRNWQSYRSLGNTTPENAPLQAQAHLAEVFLEIEQVARFYLDRETKEKPQ